MKAVCYFACKGRNTEGKEVLVEAVPVTLTFEQCNLNTIFTLEVECQYSRGGHRQRCGASHPSTDKEGLGVFCPYQVSIGHIRNFEGYNYEDYISTERDNEHT